MCDQDSTLKRCSRCKIEKPTFDFQKNKSKKDGLGTECKACMKMYLKGWYSRNTEKQRAANRENYRNNKQRYVENAKEWAKRNPEKDKKRRGVYYETHREQILARGRDHYAANPEYNSRRGREWRQANPDKSLEHVRARQTRKQQAMPSWVDRSELKAIYAESRRVSEATGIKHHVDHIVPLKNPLVCGLHVPANLRIIPALENQAKSNNLLPEETTWNT